MQNIELFDEKFGSGGALIGGNCNCEKSGALSNIFASVVLKLAGGVSGDEGIEDEKGGGKF